METIKDKLIKMLEATAGGWSIKKVLAIIFGINMAVITWFYTDHDNIVSVLYVWLGFVAVLLGISYADKRLEKTPTDNVGKSVTDINVTTTKTETTNVEPPKEDNPVI